MSKYVLTTLALFFSILSMYAQVKFKETTDVEYNYLTKGYKIQIESGLDMKKGYHFERTWNSGEIGKYNFTFKDLIRDEDSTCAATLVIAHSGISNKDYYFCIPYQNTELDQKFKERLKIMDRYISQAFVLALASRMTHSNAIATVARQDRDFIKSQLKKDGVEDGDLEEKAEEIIKVLKE